MLNLTRYQRAYQGSLEVVRVADEMLSTLLALRR
jgi:flagellar hook-associated protein FlgK